MYMTLDFLDNFMYMNKVSLLFLLLSYFLQFFREPAIYFEEEIWFDRKDKKMTMYTRNVSFTELATLEERSIYKVYDEHNRW